MRLPIPILLLLCSSVFAQDSTGVPPPSEKPQIYAIRPDNALAAVEGPMECQAGDLVVLRASGSLGTSFKWTVIPESLESKTLTIEEGRGIVFASKEPIIAYFILAVAGKDTVDVTVHALNNGEARPGPRPPPRPPTPGPVDPKPPPNPPEPGNWQLSLQRAARDHAISSVATPGRQSCALTLSRCYTTLARGIGEGLYKDIAEARVATREYNHKTLGWDNTKVWTPWAEKMAVELERLSSEGRLSTLEGVKTAYESISAGLKEVE